MEGNNTEAKEKEPAEDNRDADEAEKKSITEEDSAAIVGEKLEDTAATKPDSLPHNEK